MRLIAHRTLNRQVASAGHLPFLAGKVSEVDATSRQGLPEESRVAKRPTEIRRQVSCRLTRADRWLLRQKRSLNRPLRIQERTLRMCLISVRITLSFAFAAMGQNSRYLKEPTGLIGGVAGAET